MRGKSSDRELEMSDLDVVVIIVTYKSAQLTINSITSIQAERSTPGLRIRVIVVDNASGDLDAIAQASEVNGWSSWVTLLPAPRNGGFGYGNNLAIRHAYQESAPNYFFFLNPDTEVRAGAIGSLVRFLEDHPDVGVAGSGIENPDGTDWSTAFRFPTLLSELSAGLETAIATRFLRRWEVPQRMSKQSQPIDWVSGASMMIRPALLAAIGGLDENYFLYFEETDFCFRARRAGYSTWYVPESRVMHIEGQSTKVNERNVRPRRFPAYWFESRRRYFAVNLGVGRAIVIDIVALFARSLGFLKRLAVGKMHTATPHFIRDLIRHSVLWPNNRNFPPVRSFRPKS
jgi:N-acetylglucosaminyl-diphospho-decaprenol L-rhamnosyltransferase